VRELQAAISQGAKLLPTRWKCQTKFTSNYFDTWCAMALSYVKFRSSLHARAGSFQ
jgi:hypothetical protein